MKRHELIHRIALLSLAVVATMSFVGTLRTPLGTSVERILHPFFALGIWIFLLWKVWKRPQRWGLGVGIFLLLMIVFQSYLWHIAVTKPTLDPQGIPSLASFVLLYELPIFIAGASCILLRFLYPSGSNSSATAT